jgi:hypothetical protein
VTNQILEMYLKYPKLFGGNVGTNNFDALSTPFGIITDGKLPDDATAGDILCLLYRKLIRRRGHEWSCANEMNRARNNGRAE